MTGSDVGARALFIRKSRSFSLAARLFAPADQDAVARLYRFCRTVDDFADRTLAGETDQLARVRANLLDPTGPASDPVTADFLALAAERDLPLEAAVALVDASSADCGPRRIESPDELVRFAHGVAGTVGLLLRPVIGADDPRAAPFAIDLGIALQLTNVVRDVAEDAARGRYYLPATWVTPATIDSALAGPADPAALELTDQAVRRVLDLSKTYYRSARVGHWFVPPRNRRVTYLAAGLYEAIGHRVWRERPAAWRRRITLSPAQLATVAGLTAARYLRSKRTLWNNPEPPTHDASLHRPLAPVASPTLP
jgi:phytoene synthase